MLEPVVSAQKAVMGFGPPEHRVAGGVKLAARTE